MHVVVTMHKEKDRKPPAVYGVVAWLAVNVIFYALEVSVFLDAADPNNSILLILSVASTAGLLTMRKIGAALTIFTLIYAFAFNAFNIMYFQIYLLNGISAILNAVAIIYMFFSVFKNIYI
jgi:hypothetical protein